MANGKELNDEALTGAMWGVPFGSQYRITRVDRPDLSVIITITDRGPAKRLVAKGRKLDLSKKAMELLGGIKKGIIQVEVTKLK